VTSSGAAGAAEVGELAWTGGSVNGKVKSTGGATITGAVKNMAGGELTLGGDTEWDGSRINASGAAKLKNEAGKTFTASADGLIASDSASGGSTFTNAGIFTKSGGVGGATEVQARFDNTGTVNVKTGKLHLSGGGGNGANAAINVEETAALELAAGLSLDSLSELKGSGVARLLGGVLDANGVVAIANFEFAGGELAGSNVFGGKVKWAGGSWSSAVAGVTTMIAQNGELELNQLTGHDFNGRSIVNKGTVNWRGGNLRGGNGSEFKNDFLFNDLVGGNKTMVAPGAAGGTFTFTNNGIYRKTEGGTTTVEVAFTNQGTLDIASGTMVFAGTFTNHGGLKVTNGAGAQFSDTLVFSAGMPLSGNGRIEAPLVRAAGLVSPGISPGTLTLTGDLTLERTSELLIELAGRDKGATYDFLSIGGAAAFDGLLRIAFLGGFQNSVLDTDKFTVLTAANGLSGAFTNVASGARLLTADGIGTFRVDYGTGDFLKSVVLSDFQPVPEPSTWALLLSGASAVVWTAMRRRRESR
jgi:hypothetical protein